MIKKALAIFLFTLTYVCSKAQHEPREPDYFSKLRAKFDKTFSKNFELQKDEIIEEKDFRYFWVATLKPKDTGVFTIRYNFKIDTISARIYTDVFYSKQLPNFDNGIIEFTIKVVKQKTNPNQYLYSDTVLVSLDEKLLIPVKVDDIYTEHEFFTNGVIGDYIAQRSFTKDKKEAVRSAYQSHIAFAPTYTYPGNLFPEYDNVDEHMINFKWNDTTLSPEFSFYKCDDVFSKRLNPGTYLLCLKYYQDLYLKAHQTGKWDLKIKSHVFLLDEGYPNSRTTINHHIVIIDKNMTKYVLPWAEAEYRYIKNKETAGYLNFNFYPTNCTIAKVEEIFELPVLAIRKGTFDYETIEGIFKDGPFTIQKKPLNTDTPDDFSAWIANKYK